VTTTAATASTRRYTGSYPAEPIQVRQVRAALAALLHGCPRADDTILVASEYATNSVVHSASSDGGQFTVRADVQQNHVRIEVEDGGGPWQGTPGDDGRPHGFDVVAAIAGPQNWGVDGDTDGRVAWATLSW
jgi:serine/threonine-protein kinase RsbW